MFKTKEQLLRQTLQAEIVSAPHQPRQWYWPSNSLWSSLSSGCYSTTSTAPQLDWIQNSSHLLSNYLWYSSTDHCKGLWAWVLSNLCCPSPSFHSDSCTDVTEIQTCVLRIGRIQYTGFFVWELLCFSVYVRYASSLVRTENPSLLFWILICH